MKIRGSGGTLRFLHTLLYTLLHTLLRTAQWRSHTPVWARGHEVRQSPVYTTKDTFLAKPSNFCSSGSWYVHYYITSCNFPLINPQRACTARVTVLGLCVCVCVSVSLRLFSHYRQQSGIRAIPTDPVQQALEK